MKSNDIAWLAGLLEGEGTFCLRGKSCAKISCAMTDYDIINRLQAITNKGNIYIAGKEYKHHKQAWIWVVHGINAYNIMVEIKPYMGIRRTKKIEEIISAYDQHIIKLQEGREERIQFIEEVKLLYTTTNHSERSIAKLYNVSHVTVHNWLHS